MSEIIFFITAIVLFGCSSSSLEKKISMKNSLETFSYRDETGKFLLKRSTILKKNKIFTKSILYSKEDPDREVEKSTTISELGILHKKDGQQTIATRPSVSQYEAWYDGKKYFSQLKVNLKTKKLEVVVSSPEKKYSKSQQISFPKGKYFCFFSQIPECLGAMGFFKKAISLGQGKLDFYVIWNSYPFQNEQFSGLAEGAFSTAHVEFDGQSDGAYKFTLEVDGQNVFYNFNKKAEFEKMFWVAQGVTMIVN